MNLGHDREFILLMKEALDRYPRDTRFPRLLFLFCGRNQPSSLLTELTSAALKRLPVLIHDDPELAYIAAPFIRDREEAARYVAAYRAFGSPNPLCLPQSLYLGLIDDDLAVTELFARRAGVTEKVLDRELILSVWKNLRGEPGRNALRRNLLSYTGVIKEDEDNDGIFEVSVSYKNGLLHTYTYDADQDGLPEWTISFAAGVPSGAEVSVFGGENRRTIALIRWERYPAVLNAELGKTRYFPRPMDFFFTPLRFAEFVPGGQLYPIRNEFDTLVTERSLLSFSVMTEGENPDFPGSTERTEFADSVPLSAKTVLRGKLAAETEFRNGRPFIQRCDLDSDGRMETIRHFSGDEYGLVIASESDWDGDGSYEYAEILQSDGTVKKYWHLDKDGKRETEQ
jgi:antitoxin component YwqK of YwqJK toxin-antitoxin module